MLALIILTAAAIFVSFMVNRQKTLLGIMKGLQQFLRLFPWLLMMLIMVSVVLYLIPEEVLTKYLGEGSGALGWVMAAFLGLRFSILCTIITLPLFIVIGFFMEKLLKSKNFRVRQP